ncbi:MAG TPA: SRPBCC family protein [Acidimicrobiia bacterium]|nr:SRPBCC family protein [Acidimicrobiia bacterium]
MPTPFAFDRAWDFAVPPAELWGTLARTDQYPRWWPWLREFRVTGDGLAVGSIAEAVIQAPLPYQLHCTIEVLEADAPHVLAATVTGDLAGPARLELRPTATGAEARLAWTLEVQSSLLRPFAVVARPVLAWAHDRIVERGLGEFEAIALTEPTARD